MWVLLTSQEAAQRLGDGTDYQSLIGDGAVDWIANSSDGSLATASILREDTAASFAVRPARLTRSLDGGPTPLTNGDYHAYVLIADADAAVPPIRPLRAAWKAVFELKDWKMRAPLVSRRP